VLGKVQGNITASGRVELRAGCQLVGDIRASRLAVEDNAGVRGKVDLSQASRAGEATSVLTSPAATVAGVAGGVS
jgi:cytoskeletal protein CcmA (bactofilin family)